MGAALWAGIARFCTLLWWKRARPWAEATRNCTGDYVSALKALSTTSATARRHADGRDSGCEYRDRAPSGSLIRDRLSRFPAAVKLPLRFSKFPRGWIEIARDNRRMLTHRPRSRYAMAVAEGVLKSPADIFPNVRRDDSAGRLQLVEVARRQTHRMLHRPILDDLAAAIEIHKLAEWGIRACCERTGHHHDDEYQDAATRLSQQN